MKNKISRSLLAMLLAVVLILSVTPAQATAVERSVSSNYDALVNHIETNGVMNEELGMKTIAFYVDSDQFTTYFFLMNHSEGVAFDVTMIGTDSIQTMIGTGFILEKTNNTLDVEFGVMLAQNDELIDELTTTKSINRTTFTTDSTYTINASSAYISSADATSLFNSTLQMLCEFWDEYLCENLGFGLTGLGFTSYDRYLPEICFHTYDNDCDTSCNLCGAVRETSHSYGNWTETETGHQQVCSTCGDTQSGDHNWGVGVVTQKPTEDTTGIITYTCADCSAEKTVEVDYIPGDIDGNGVVEQDDAVYLLLHTMFGEEFYPIAMDADIDKDGVVTQEDAVYLLLHTMFGESFYPLN